LGKGGRQDRHLDVVGDEIILASGMPTSSVIVISTIIKAFHYSINILTLNVPSDFA